MKHSLLAVFFVWSAACAFGQGHQGQPAIIVPPFVHHMPTDSMPVQWTTEIPDYLSSDNTLLQMAANIDSVFPKPTVAVAFGATIGEDQTNLGVDISVPVGTPVHALAAGTVIATQYDDGFGIFLVIAHGNNLYSIYGHLSGYAGLHKGDKASPKQTIGYSGVTGLTLEPTVHIAVVKDGQYLDPLLLPKFLLQKPSNP